jgi:hypothetical protein
MEIQGEEYIHVDIKSIKQKCYIFLLDDNGEESFNLTEVYLNSAPDIGEEIIIWQYGKFTTYILKDRKLGINADSCLAVWNLYVRPKERK